MIKCAYNGLKLGHTLVKKKIQIKFINWSNRWARHTQRQDKSFIAKPLCLSTLLECKNRIENIPYK